MKDTDTVAIITVGTIIKNNPLDNQKDNEAKTELVKAIKNGFEIISAVPTLADGCSCITYVLKKALPKKDTKGDV